MILLIISVLVVAFLLFWLYLGYYLFLYLLSIFKRRSFVFKKLELPRISLLITVYNEESFIEKKIKNTLNLDYDPRKLEIIVIDDDSTDRTPEIVRKYRGIKLIRKKKRSGKARSVNLGMRAAENEIVIVSDGNSVLNKQALKVLASYFQDQSVGAVTGVFAPLKRRSGAVEISEGVFWRLDRKSLEIESKFDSAVYLCGQVMAFRKSVAREINEENLTEDFELALKIRKQGYRAVCDSRAVSYKYPCDNFRDMMIQRKRRAIGTLQTLREFKSMLFNPAYGWFGLVFLPSHKLFQMLSPFFVIALYLLTLVGVLLDPNWFFVALLLAELVFLGLGFVALLLRRKVALLGIFYTFWFGQWIVLAAWKDYLLGNYAVTWQTIKSAR